MFLGVFIRFTPDFLFSYVFSPFYPSIVTIYHLKWREYNNRADMNRNIDWLLKGSEAILFEISSLNNPFLNKHLKLCKISVRTGGA